jgi:hypothetical protein
VSAREQSVPDRLGLPVAGNRGLVEWPWPWLWLPSGRARGSDFLAGAD